ncbi:MAG: head-tail connector protein [Bacteroidales bacterium]|nr:head-tail connector protein [Bacteroidales bacterium]
MVVSLEEMKQYLRVDFEDDDGFITNALHSAESLCADIARLSAEEFSETQTTKIAVMYAVAYLYEHREDADHHALTLSLRSLLEGVRRSKF